MRLLRGLRKVCMSFGIGLTLIKGDSNETFTS